MRACVCVCACVCACVWVPVWSALPQKRHACQVCAFAFRLFLTDFVLVFSDVGDVELLTPLPESVLSTTNTDDMIIGQPRFIVFFTFFFGGGVLDVSFC